MRVFVPSGLGTSPKMCSLSKLSQIDRSKVAKRYFFRLDYSKDLSAEGQEISVHADGPMGIDFGCQSLSPAGWGQKLGMGLKEGDFRLSHTSAVGPLTVDL